MLEKLFHSCQDEFISFINHMSDAVFVMEVEEGLSLKYTAVNQAGLDMFGLKSSVIGQRIEDVLELEDISFIRKKSQQVLDSNEMITFYQDIHGNRKAETSLNVMRGRGNVTYILAIIRDVTTKDEIKKKLEEKKQKYKSLVEYNPDGIYELDLEGHFVSANEVCEEITGYQAEELLHVSYEAALAPEDKERTAYHFKEAIAGVEQTYTVKVKHKDGHFIDCLIKNVPIYVNGEVTGVYGIAKDISQEQRYHESLKNSEERYRHLVDNSPIAVFVHKGFIEYVNDAAVGLLGAKGKEQLIGKNFYDFFPFTDRKDIQENHEAILKNERTTTHSERQITTMNGNTLDVESYTVGTVFKEHDMLHSVVRDVSSQKQLEREVKESEELYRLIAENSTDLIELLDTDGTITYASPSHAKVLGQAPKKWEGQTLSTFVHPEDVSHFQEGLEELVETCEVITLELRLEHNDGERWVWIESQMVPIHDNEDNIENILFTGGNITDRKQYEEQIHHMAYHDALTGLPNRRLFYERLEEVLDAARQDKETFAILYLDCDHFKPINDELGHDAGDEFLKTLAGRLKRCTRDSDTIARIGGDEFNILLPGIRGEQEVEDIAERVLDAASAPWEFNGSSFSVSLSIGVALYPEDGDTKDELIKKADQALFVAKEDGRNTIRRYSANPLY